MKYKDLNGDGVISTDDMGPVGYSDWPEVTYSLSGGFSWKGFDVSILFQGTDNVSTRFESASAYPFTADWRSEEHTSELQSRENLVCRLLLEKKKNKVRT